MAGGVRGVPCSPRGISWGGAQFWHHLGSQGSSGRAATGTWGGVRKVKLGAGCNGRNVGGKKKILVL